MAKPILAGSYDTTAHLTIRRIGFPDLFDALRRGAEDFVAMPSHLLFLGLIYPVLGIALAALTFRGDAVPLLYPLASGFALIGPFAALGLYEISRRRERGLEPTWRDAFEVVRSPAAPAIAMLGLVLALLFLCWIGAARILVTALLGPAVPATIGGFLGEVVSTGRGWSLILIGNLVGFVFAVVVLSISVVSFPLLLDRHVGAVQAIQTSVQAVARNPIAMGAWGLIVAAALLVGSLPLFVGLAVVMPILGHATWHLYRRTVVD